MVSVPSYCSFSQYACYLPDGCYHGSKIIPSFFTIKEGSTFLTKPLFNSLYAPFGSPSSGGQKPQEREDVAGSAIAPPGFWSASGACARKGLAGSAYAIKLRL